MWREEIGTLHQYLDASRNRQRFPHFHAQVWVKKPVQESRLRIATLEQRSILGERMKLPDTTLKTVAYQEKKKE